MIKVFLITQNEPFYIPKMVNHLIENQGDVFTFSGYTVLSPTRKNKSIKHWFNERAKIYSSLELIIVGLAFVYSKFAKLLKLSSNYNNKSLLSKAGVREVSTNDINSKQFIDQLNEDKPDIILSISCPQLFGEELLKTPNLYCINAHGTLLPSHRGVFGSFWTLYDNDSLAGGTLHTMELKLDAGEIIWQEAFSVKAKDTQYSIAYKTKKIMAKGLVEVFKILNKQSDFEPKKSKYPSSYHRAPSADQGKELKRKGKRIVRLSDLKLMLSNFY